jgi:hypothetical protein
VAGLFSWGAKKADAAEPRPPSRIVESLAASRALPKFLSMLTAHRDPVLLDLGPVVGANVSFFGEQLACKMVIEDLHEEVESLPRDAEPGALAGRMVARLQSAVAGPIHGVLCWDIFDYLDRATARELGGWLAGQLHSKGALHGFFGATSGRMDTRAKYILQSPTSFKIRREPGTPVHRHALQTGEISRLFPGLTIVESVLMQNTTRESLFRKA